MMVKYQFLLLKIERFNTFHQKDLPSIAIRFLILSFFFFFHLNK